MVQIDEESKFENKDLTKDEIIIAYNNSLKACYEEMKITDEKVEQLQAERDRLKEAIKEFSDKWKYYDSKTITGLDDLRAALREVDGGKENIL